MNRANDVKTGRLMAQKGAIRFKKLLSLSFFKLQVKIFVKTKKPVKNKVGKQNRFIGKKPEAFFSLPILKIIAK